MQESSKTLVVRIREFEDNTVSLVTFPNHFEITANFMDNYDEVKNQPPTKLWMTINFNSIPNRDYAEGNLVEIVLFPQVEIPIEYFGEFVIEETGFKIIDRMLDLISRDIAFYITDMDAEKEPFFEIEAYEDRWRELLETYISRALNELKKETIKEDDRL